MAEENIKAVKPLFKYSIGNRFMVVGEATFAKEYKTEGCEFSTKQLEEIGLPEAIVDWGTILSSPKAAKGVENCVMQFTVTKPGFEESGQKTKIQAYESVTTKANKELAGKSEEYKEAPIIVLLVGK